MLRVLFRWLAQRGAILACVSFAGCSGGGDQPRVPASVGSAQTSVGSTRASARVTIGTTLYEFDMTGVPGQCRNTGTAIVGSFNVDAQGRPLPVTETGALLQINFDIPAPNPSDPDAVPPRIFVVDTTQAQMWLAGADASEGLQPEHSVVTTWTLVDGVARGTAAFAEINSYGASPKATQGTFEIVCSS